MQTPTLDELVANYGKNDAQIKELKKVCDSDKEQIKQYLTDIGEQQWSSGGYVVQKVVSEKETLNEDKLLPIIKHYWSTTHGSMQCPYIKTKEYIDMDALESAIYSGELTQGILMEMDSCRETTTIVSLRCKKAKEEKQDGTV